MTYFNYRHIRCTHSDRVYVDSTLIGRVTTHIDWRLRLTLSDTPTFHYRAKKPSGNMLPTCYHSRHDAAEALYELMSGPRASGARDATSAST